MKLPKIKELFQVLKFVYKSDWKKALLREMALLIQVALEVWSISLVGQFIDSTAEYLANYSTFSFQNYFYSDSFYYLALTTGFGLLIVSLDRYRQAALGTLYHKTVYNFETEFFGKISKTNLQDVETKEFRDLIALTQKYSLDSLWNTYKTFTELIRHIVTGVSAITLLITSVNWYALVIIAISLPEPIIGYYYKRKRHKFEEKEIEKTKWNSYVETLMTNIQSFMELRVDNTFKKLLNEYNDKSTFLKEKRTHIHNHYMIDTTLFSVIGRVLVVIYVIYAFAVSIVSRLTIGHVKVIYDYAMKVYDSFYNFFEMSFQITNWVDYSSNFFKFLNYQGFGDESSGEMSIKNMTPKLQFFKLDFKYPHDDVTAIENLNLEVQPGEKIMIVGDDGSGKSTLVKLICGLYKIEGGDYEIDEISIRQLKRGELKKKISAIFQDYINYSLTLKKNITLSSESSKIDENLYEVAKKISGVDKMMKKYQVDDDQMLGKYLSNGREISPGFWQRIAIARMIFRNRGIFVLDEPFTYIDNQEEERILSEFIKFAGKEKTVIYITRDNRHTKFFDTIYHLKDGKLLKK